MNRRVLLCVEDAGFATGAYPLLLTMGFEAQLVDNPGELPALGGAGDVFAIVLQDSFRDGKRGGDLLRHMKNRHGRVLPAVLVCARALTEEERAPLVSDLGVRAFLKQGSAPEGLIEALQLALGEKQGAKGAPFEAQPTVLNQTADPLDMLVELSDEVLEEVPRPKLKTRLSPHQEITKMVEMHVPPEAMPTVDAEEPPTLPPDALEPILDEAVEEALRPLDQEPQQVVRGVAVDGDAQIAVLQQRLQEQQLARQQVESELEGLRQAAGDQQAREKHLRDKIKLLESSLTSAESALLQGQAGQGADLEHHQAQLAEAHGMVAEAQARVAELGDEKAELEAELKAHQKMRGSLERELADARQAFEDAERARGDDQDAQQDQKRALDEAQRLIAAAESATAEANSEVQRLQDQNAQLNERIEALEASEARLSGELGERDSKIAQLNERLELALDDAGENNGALESMREGLAEAEIAAERLKATNSELQSELDQLRRDHQTRLEEFEQQQQGHEHSLSQLAMAQERVAGLEGELQQARAEADRQTEAAEHLLAELKEASAAGAEDRTAELERQIQRLEAQVTATSGMVVDADGLFAPDLDPAPSEGRFEQLPYPRLLSRLLRNAFTGALSLRDNGGPREIFFASGKPVAYTTAAPGELLGRILVEQRRITEEQYLTAARRMVERGVRLTDALMELGYIDNEQLIEEQRFLTRDQIVNGFGTTEGAFTLSEGATPPEGTPRFEFAPGEIYVAGYRQYAPEGEVKALFETMRRFYLCASAELSSYRPQLGLEAEDERLLRMLGKAYTIEEAVVAAGLSEGRAARLLGALRGLGLIHAWNPGVGEFEGRVREMEQQHNAELLSLRKELHVREERLIDNFERALATLGVAADVAPTVDLRASVASAPFVAAPSGDRDVAAHPVAVEDREQAAELTEPNRQAVQDLVDEDHSAQPDMSDENHPHAEANERLTPDAVAEAADGTIDELASSTEDEMVSALDFAFAPPAKLGDEDEDEDDAEEKSADASGDADADVEEIDTAEVADLSGPGQARYQEGLDLAAAGKPDQAESALREAVRQDAQNPHFLSALAKVLLSNPKYDRSGTLPVVRSLLDRAHALAPENSEIEALRTRVTSEQAQLRT